MKSKKAIMKAEKKYVFNINRKRTFYVLDMGTFEEIIRKEYKQPDFNLLDDYYGSIDNGSSKFFYNIKKEKLAKFEKDDIEKFIKNCQQNMTVGLLKDMCNKGKIPEGDYLIEVCW